METNRRPAAPFDVGRQIGRVACAPRSPATAFAHLFRWTALDTITPMKMRIINLGLAAMILVVGGCATTQRAEVFPPLRVSTKPEHITLKTVGPSGQSFSAVLMVDDSRQEISGVTPAEFPLECVVLAGKVTKVDGDGSFRFVIERQKIPGRFYTPAVKDLQRFRYYSGSIEVLAQK